MTRRRRKPITLAEREARARAVTAERVAAERTRRVNQAQARTRAALADAQAVHAERSTRARPFPRMDLSPFEDVLIGVSEHFTEFEFSRGAHHAAPHR